MHLLTLAGIAWALLALMAACTLAWCGVRLLRLLRALPKCNEDMVLTDRPPR